MRRSEAVQLAKVSPPAKSRAGRNGKLLGVGAARLNGASLVREGPPEAQDVDLAKFIPKQVGEIRDHQTDLPRIAKDPKLTKAIGEAFRRVPTTHELVLRRVEHGLPAGTVLRAGAGDRFHFVHHVAHGEGHRVCTDEEEDLEPQGPIRSLS